MLLYRSLFAVLFLWAVGCVAAQIEQPILRPGVPPLPNQDPASQQWLDSMADAQMKQDSTTFVAILSEVVDAKSKRTLKDDAWLKQLLVFLDRNSDSGRLIAGYAILHYSNILLDINSETWTSSIVPYLTSSDLRVARHASEMLHTSVLLRPSSSGDNPISTLEFSGIRSYLRGLQQADPSWPLISMMYGVDTDAALRTTSNVYLARETLQLVERQYTELKILRLSLALAIPEGDEQRMRDLNQKIAAKLNEMANHPHWCVRAYALAVISAGVSRANRYTDWVWDTTVPERLAKDSNPYVSQSASGILERIKAAKSAR